MVDQADRNTVPLIRAARRAGLPVIACVNDYDTPSGAPYATMAPVSDLRRGTPVVEPDPRIAAAEPKMVSMNAAPSIFCCIFAAAILTREWVDTVSVTGSLTGGGCASIP